MSLVAKASTRVLLLGGDGLLGAYLRAALAGQATVCLPRSRHGDTSGGSDELRIDFDFDARLPHELDSVLCAAAPSVVVNCVVKKRSPASSLAMRDFFFVNGVFPHLLAEAACRYGCRVIHISSDAVFSGRRGYYHESDVPDPVDAYGYSKLAGELIRPHCLTLRTSFIAGAADKPGLVSWLLSEARQRQPIKGYSRYRLSGLHAGRLAHFVAKLVRQSEPIDGVLHVGGESWTKHWLLQALAQRLALDCEVEAVDVPDVDRSLDCRRFYEIVNEPMPSKDDLLDSLCAELEAHGGPPGDSK